MVTFMVQICVNAYVTFLYSGFSVFRFFRILALDVFRILVIFVLGVVANPYMLYLNHLVSLGSTSACMHLFCTVRVFFFQNCQIPYDVRVICLPNVFHLCHVSCTFFVFLERPSTGRSGAQWRSGYLRWRGQRGRGREQGPWVNAKAMTNV